MIIAWALFLTRFAALMFFALDTISGTHRYDQLGDLFYAILFALNTASSLDLFIAFVAGWQVLLHTEFSLLALEIFLWHGQLILTAITLNRAAEKGILLKYSV